MSQMLKCREAAAASKPSSIFQLAPCPNGTELFPFGRKAAAAKRR